MRIAYFDCFSGISGDMVLAAFLDAGLNIKTLSKELAKLKLKDFEIRKSKVRRGELVGTKCDIVVKGRPHTHTHRSLQEILRLIDGSSLNARVKKTARDIFTAIGSVEAKIHGMELKSAIHFHELGDIDSIVDIVGTAIALDALEIDEVYSSPIHFGRTLISTKAGVLPMPSPATVELLKDVPMRMSAIEAELVTPTGAGILKSLARGFGEMPQMKLSRVGYGAGSRELREIPNMLRVLIGEKQTAFREDSIYVIETNIDDMNPQNFEYLFEKLFADGALDVYTTTIQMKKTRPGFKLTVLCEPAILQKLCTTIFSETTAIGLRYYPVSRFKLERKIVSVNTKFGGVKVKLSRGPGNIMTVSPEYEECARLARIKKVPLKTVYDEAKMALKR